MSEATAPANSPTGKDPGLSWQDEGFVGKWIEQDERKELLAFPRSLTAQVVAEEMPDLRVILDIGSGPGDYLAVMLAAFPEARGIWTDSSEAMLTVARTRLDTFADRVDYRIVDMLQLGAVEDLPLADVLVTSRAAHHLSRQELFAFYAACIDRLAPGGWIANLDHTQPPGPWESRYKKIRKRSRTKPDEPGLPRHTHEHPRPTAADHTDGMSAAGFTDVELLWKAYHTCLFMGQKPAAPAGSG